MRNKTKSILQVLLIVCILGSLFLSANSAVALPQSGSDTPVAFQITNIDDDGLELVFSASAYQIAETQINGKTYDQISVPGTVESAESGYPQLPVVSTLIGVPPQSKVTLHILNHTSKEISGNYELGIAPFPAQIDEADPTLAQWDYTNVMGLDLGNTLYPASPARIAEEAWIRDQRVIRVEFWPFQYNPVTGTLVWNSSLQIDLSFEDPLGISQNNPTKTESINANLAFESLLKNTLLNYEQATAWRSLPKTSGVQVDPPDVGDRFRIAIQEDGIYKLTYEDLVAVYPDIATIDPRLFQMTSQGENVAIYVSGEADGIFDPGDYILFYGQRFYGDHLAQLYANENLLWQSFSRHYPDGSITSWKPEFNAIMLEKYTHENIYWLYIDTAFGKRMQTTDGDPSGNSNPPVASYRETVRAEESTRWKTTLFAGEDTWFWEYINQGDTAYTYDTNLTAIAFTGPDIAIRGEIVSQTYNPSPAVDHHTEVSINANLINNNYSNYWYGKSRYHFESLENPSVLVEGTNTLQVIARKDAEVTNPQMFFDWFEVEYNRAFVAEDDAITFSSTETGLQKYEVSNFSSTNDIQVLNVTNPLVPIRILNPAVGSGLVTISLTHNPDITITISEGTKSVPVGQLSYYEPPDWAALATGADYVFITHASLINSTQTLANYKENEGYSTAVLDIEDLYNEFNFGIFHPIAIKNFLAYSFENWQTIPTYALVIGDGHWNFHEYNLAYYGSGNQLIPPNLAWVDPWQGEVDSTNLLATIIGDDAFADLIIARLPVNSEAELDTYIDKLIAYESAPSGEGWQQNHIFIADNPDSAGDFTAFAEEMVEQYIDPYNQATALEIYQEDFGCSSYSSPECDAIRYAITNTINITGSLIVNFIGHASVGRWSSERVLNLTTIEDLTNLDRYPVILSMSCLDGYWSGPSGYPGTSIIEELVRKNNSGAIAAFSPTGLGVSTGHDILHKGFYDSLMNDGNWELGAAAMKAKLWLFNTGSYVDLLHTYTIFGDPTLEILNPFQFEVTPEESTQTTYWPGSTVTHLLTLTNTGSEADTYTIEANSTWTVTHPSSVSVNPGNQIDIPIDITTPNLYEVSDTALVTITSSGNSAHVFQSQLTTIIPKVYDFEVTPTEALIRTWPETTITHTLTLTNQGFLGNRYSVDLSGNSWPTSSSVTTTQQIDPDQSTKLYIRVETPNQQDVTDVVIVTISAEEGPDQSIQAVLSTRVPRDYEFEVSPLNITQVVAPGETITYTFTLLNGGLQTDSYQIEVSNNAWPTIPSATLIESLDFNESTQFTIRVETPQQKNISDTALITISSVALPEETQQVTITTMTSSIWRYLPVILK